MSILGTKENGINMLGGMGCLPLLVQMPFFSAMYFAAQYTQGVSESTFLGIDLGTRSIPLTAVIAVLYFFQSWLSMQGVAEEQRGRQVGAHALVAAFGLAHRIVDMKVKTTASGVAVEQWREDFMRQRGRHEQRVAAQPV